MVKNIDYLKTQIGNPEGADVPNKKYYDPRKWLRESDDFQSLDWSKHLLI
jgi:fructose-bisphosphate aldolase class II